MKTSNRDWDRFLVSLDYLTSLSANDTISFLKCFSVNHHIKDKEMTAKPWTKTLLVVKFGSKEKRSNQLKYWEQKNEKFNDYCKADNNMYRFFKQYFDWPYQPSNSPLSRGSHFVSGNLKSFVYAPLPRRQNEARGA